MEGGYQHSLAKGMLLGLGVFIGSSALWGFVAAFPMWVLDLDPSEEWWQRVGYFALIFLPMAGYAFLGMRFASRASGRHAGILTLGLCLFLVVAGFSTLAVLYPYD